MTSARTMVALGARRCRNFLVGSLLVGNAMAAGLDLSTLDRSADPCADFAQYVCGGWQRDNPIPADQSSWSTYHKLFEQNLVTLRGVLEQAASESQGDPTSRQIGDYYRACMDEPAVEARGIAPIQGDLRAIARAASLADLWPLIARLQRELGGDVMFAFGSTQDADDSRRQIAALDQGGLGLPDRDYYLTSDEKSVAIRAQYLMHIARLFELAGQAPDSAVADAGEVLRLETALATASLDRVARRDPYQVTHKMTLAAVVRLAPSLPWARYFATFGKLDLRRINVGVPKFLAELSRRVAGEPLPVWQAYLRFHLLDAQASNLSPALVAEDFDFHGRILSGTQTIPARWKRCVTAVDHQLGEALGQAYVRTAFPEAAKESVLDMVQRIEIVMAERIRARPWMSAATKQAALGKLRAIRNKIGYPEHWRDYSMVRIDASDFVGNVARAAAFEFDRQLAKIGRPVDRDEWNMTPPTVNAYFDSQMNDINFPAGILQPPLYDPALDDAPNYGDTGGTIGHELTHAFDDSGRQYDAHGNLRNWWTKKDAKRFAAQTQCIVDQYGKYTVIDDIRLNSKLTVGEDVADLGGQILAYVAWQQADAGVATPNIDGFTPEQRFFIGFGQWACENVRPEHARKLALTDPHSPARYRINGVVVNMPEFARAFSCQAGAPMTKPKGKACEVW